MAKVEELKDIRARVAAEKARKIVRGHHPIVFRMEGQTFVDGVRAEHIDHWSRPCALDANGVYWMLDGSGEAG